MKIKVVLHVQYDVLFCSIINTISAKGARTCLSFNPPINR